jgi:hypothetical protein
LSEVGVGKGCPVARGPDYPSVYSARVEPGKRYCYTLGFSVQVEGSSVRQPRAFQRWPMPEVPSSKGGSGLSPAK